MADLTITAASVLKGTGAQLVYNYSAGEAITAGQAVRLNTSNVWVKADNDTGTASDASVGGIAMNSAGTSQPVVVCTGGTINIGATTVKGVIYVLSSTAGGICPDADLGSGDVVSIIGVASATDGTFVININNTGISV